MQRVIPALCGGLRAPSPPPPVYLILISALIHSTAGPEAGAQASPVVLGGRCRGVRGGTQIHANQRRLERGQRGENVALRPRPVGSICSSQDFAFVQSGNNG